MGELGKNPMLATTVTFDFLALLQAALARRGLAYNAIVNELSDNELPTGRDLTMLKDVRMSDRDVILVRQGITTANPTNHAFKTEVPLNLGTKIPLRIRRGYQTVEVQLDGARFTFVNSHLEVGAGPLKVFQEQQANDLAAALAAVPGTVIVVGDFNSPADRPDTMSYKVLTTALTDPWKDVRPGVPGFTCCTSLTSETFMADTRIDLVLYRGPVRAEAAEVIGTSARAPTTKVFASDHAGVVMTLSVPRAN
jgi:endonuclease/exonuclease/phosphatase family metal-dependent hydrolase